MTKTPNDRLTDLDLFPTGMVPKVRRRALESLLRERSVTVDRVISCGAMLALCAVFFLFYGGVCVLAWANGANPTFGVVFSMLSAVMLVATAVLARQFQEHLSEVIPVPAKLRLEAEAEAALESAALDINVKSIFWNDAARSARQHGVSDPIVRGLLAQRAALERRRLDISDSLRRFEAATDS